jgi:glycosyltransferase involved in cell wall biosynthesis
MRLLCTSLDADTFDITLITGCSHHLTKKTEAFLENFKGRIITVPGLQRDVHPWRDLVAFVNIYRLLRKERFDIVHTHTAKAGTLARIASWLTGGAKVVHTSHGHNFYGYFGSVKSRLIVVAERALTHITDKLTALTELEKEDLNAYGVSGPERVAVINSGLELDLYREVSVDKVQKRNELGIRQDTVLISLIARLEPVKGPEYFVRAAHLVGKKFPGVEFLIVGEGSLRNQLEKQCKSLKIIDKVIFTGWREDIPQILKTLDIVVLPSLNEAVGRTLIEAGACGKPVVATRVGGIPEVVKDGESGLLVPPCDAYELSLALITLIEDKQKRLDMGAAAKQWIDDKFSASRMVGRFSDLYEQLGEQNRNNEKVKIKFPGNSDDNNYINTSSG